MENKSIKRVGAGRPRKGVKVVDLAEKRSAPERKKKQDWGKIGSIMIVAK